MQVAYPSPSLHQTNAAHADRSARLAAVIREHGHPCRVQADGSIRVASYGMRVSDRRGVWSVDVLPCDRRVVMEWLGY